MKVYCKKHPAEQLRVMFIHTLRIERKKKQGTVLKTDWLFCKKCNKPYKVKVILI